MLCLLENLLVFSLCPTSEFLENLGDEILFKGGRFVTAPDLINSNKIIFIGLLFIFTQWALGYNLNPPFSSQSPKPT